MSRLLLQVVNGMLALITIGMGASSLLLGVESPIYDPEDIPQVPVLDSNLRFMGGMGIGLGVALLWILPTIEKQALLFRVIWICALLGGIGRLISLAQMGVPSLPIVIFTAIEVPGVPLLIYWHYRVAKLQEIQI